jgi:hypothetical protein
VLENLLKKVQEEIKIIEKQTKNSSDNQQVQTQIQIS